MKPAAGSPKAKGGLRKSPTRATRRLIHPIIIYPFRQSADYSDLEALYRWVGCLSEDREQYAQPITVLDRKTFYANRSQPAFLKFRDGTVAQHSTILDAWCVDTCQMWYSGLAAAYESGQADDVAWLIPGDFNYGTAQGRKVLERLHHLPEIIVELDQDLCIGEIATSHHHPKHLIDSYGTCALLSNWFPLEAREIRQVTERPRSEFFAIRHSFLGEALQQRWYAYEQTLVLLLHAISGGRRISRFFVGDISDLPDGRESMVAALQQVERTERLLKSLWRERHASCVNWLDEYWSLESQSDLIRKAALRTLQNLLT